MIAAAPQAAPRPPSVGESLRQAGRDFYEESWRLVLLNSLFSACVLLVLVLALCRRRSSCSSRPGRCSRGSWQRR